MCDKMEDVFLQVQRKKTTLFLHATDNMKVIGLKTLIAGIYLKRPKDQCLMTDKDIIMEDSKTLGEYGYLSTICKPQSPGFVKLSLRTESGELEPFDVASYSDPPDLLVMEDLDATGSD